MPTVHSTLVQVNVEPNKGVQSPWCFSRSIFDSVANCLLEMLWRHMAFLLNQNIPGDVSTSGSGSGRNPGLRSPSEGSPLNETPPNSQGFTYSSWVPITLLCVRLCLYGLQTAKSLATRASQGDVAPIGTSRSQGFPTRRKWCPLPNFPPGNSMDRAQNEKNSAAGGGFLSRVLSSWIIYTFCQDHFGEQKYGYSFWAIYSIGSELLAERCSYL